MIETRKIVIDPVTRVEGHGKVTIRLNEDGSIGETRFASSSSAASSDSSAAGHIGKSR
jgi:coenzyme F420-reducing hydrogenase alpha subunit